MTAGKQFLKWASSNLIIAIRSFVIVAQLNTYLFSYHREQVEARYKSIMVVHGDRGSGKSTLISNWIQKFKVEYRDVKVICQYVGCSGRSADISIFLRHCIKELREEYLRPGGQNSLLVEISSYMHYALCNKCLWLKFS